MAGVAGDLLHESLIELCVDTDLRAFHLSIEHRNQTNDSVTLEAAQDVVEKYHLKHTWMSPNAAIRNTLGGDVFRKPNASRNIPPLMNQWRRSIITARHAFGDQYNSQDFVVPGSGTLQIKYSPSIGAPYNHDEINDTITLQATQALEVHNVGGVKCAITS
ncbi:isocitrate dehydrogenase [NADP] cytoplasmic [Dermacentor silvarum]|uniref:isocitrate dehydrogenase [NADP] cytoplasmic n=1 Tax=Dermacentor silvarum TaxID=543639 RepID=UPI001899AE0A|nr:isocitrate dehydrogenase [NADP] cytoplasmic [Dermacentor silvarum]